MNAAIESAITTLEQELHAIDEQRGQILEALEALRCADGRPDVKGITQYGEAIVTFLSKQELRCGDTMTLRAAVIKACGLAAKSAADSKFRHDVANALTKLRMSGSLTRKGTIWTLASTE